MELAIFNNPIPIKAIPEKDLTVLIMGDFLDWISATLSLNEDAILKLEFALPAIKEHCWSMGFPEIKKMIEMYADGKLAVKPIPNHFDRIKFGEVVNAYRQQKKVVKKEIKMPEITQEEKDLLVYGGVINCFESWKQDGYIMNGYAWVEQHLRDKMEFTDEEKKQMWKLSLKYLKDYSRTMSRIEAKTFLRELETKGDTKRVVQYQLIRLDRYFKKIADKGKNIKEIL